MITHTEECSIYLYTKIANTSGGYIPGAPIEQTDAPTWYTIEQVSGNDIEVSSRKATESIFTVKCNYPLNGFAFNDTMFIASRFGHLDIINITQSPKRKRDYTLTAVRIEGVSDASGGQIVRLYAFPTPGSTSITIEALIGKDVLLIFRDGIEKWVVEEDPTEPNQLEYDSITGIISTMAGDIFGNERITVLYRT